MRRPVDREPKPEQGNQPAGGPEQPATQIVRHMRMPRRSTIILLVAFVATLALYLAVKPIPAPASPPIYAIVPSTTTSTPSAVATTLPRTTTTSTKVTTTTSAAASPSTTELPSSTTSTTASTSTTESPSSTTSTTAKNG